MKSLLIIIAVYLSIQLFAQDESLLSLLPAIDELNGFELIENPEYYKGDDLFFLINGGADIYLEYGFKDVISATYKNEPGLSFKVEIYQMLHDSAAYGIFSFNRGDKPMSHEIGDESIHGKEFLIFIKAHYYIVLTTQVNDETQKVNLVEKAKLIATKIKGSGSLPLLVAEFDQLAPHHTYLLGNLALSNIYLFDFTDIFQFADGLFFKQNYVSTFVFSYPSDEITETTFQKVKSRLQNSSRFQNYEEIETVFYLTDKKEQKLLFTSHESRIYIFMGIHKPDLENQVKIMLK